MEVQSVGEVLDTTSSQAVTVLTHFSGGGKHMRWGLILKEVMTMPLPSSTVFCRRQLTEVLTFKLITIYYSYGPTNLRSWSEIDIT